MKILRTTENVNEFVFEVEKKATKEQTLTKKQIEKRLASVNAQLAEIEKLEDRKAQYEAMLELIATQNG